MSRNTSFKYVGSPDRVVPCRYRRPDTGGCKIALAGAPHGSGGCPGRIDGTCPFSAGEPLPYAVDLFEREDPPDLIPVVSVTITRAERPTALCGKPRTFSSFEQASAWLWSQAGTLPKTGGYDKHDFLVTWADGETYSGQLACRAPGTPSDPDLDVRQHILNFARFFGGLQCPPHLSQAQYEEYLDREERAYPGAREDFRKFIRERLQGSVAEGEEE